MIIVLKSGATNKDLKVVVKAIETAGFQPHVSKGAEATIVGVIGDERKFPIERFQLFPSVEKIIPVLKPYKLASRDFKPTDTTVKVDGVAFGHGTFSVIAGPCAI